MSWRCHGASPIQENWRSYSATPASMTSMWNRSSVKAPLMASMTIGRLSKKASGKSRRHTALEEADRRSVRDYVNARLAQYESADGKLTMGVEMLVGRGRAADRYTPSYQPIAT